MYFGNFPYVVHGDFLIRDFLRVAAIDPATLVPEQHLALEQVQDGERPDVLSRRLYGLPKFDWTFFAVNNWSPEDWPLSSQQLDAWVDAKLGVRADRISHYLSESGERVQRLVRRKFTEDVTSEDVEFYEDGSGYGALAGDFLIATSLTPVTYRETYAQANDAKRTIRTVRKEHMGQFINDFIAVINGRLT